jgi:hypothetical protein
VQNVVERLESLKVDPWADYAGRKLRITISMRDRLGMKGG